MKLTWRIRAFLWLVAAPSYLVAQRTSVNLDPAKSRIEFTLGDVLHTVHGTFALKSGHVEFNPQTREVSGEAIVNAASGDSASAARDGRMKRDILQVDRYPEIKFIPSSLQGDISKVPATVTLMGSFFIHGQQHAIAIPMQVNISGRDVVANGHFAVPYVAWGMKNPSTFILRVDQEVDIAVTAVGTVIP